MNQDFQPVLLLYINTSCVVFQVIYQHVLCCFSSKISQTNLNNKKNEILKS